jgi:O-antigen/teichoic acid export membrane protein
LTAQAGSWVVFLVLSAAAQALGSLSLWLIARPLSVEEFGLFMANWGLAAQVAVLAGFGLDTWLLREATREPLGVALGRALLTKAFLWVILLPLIAIVAPAVRPASYRASLLLLAGIAWSATTFVNAVASGLQGAKRAELAGALRAGLSSVALVFVSVASLMRPSATTFMEARAIAAVVSLILITATLCQQKRACIRPTSLALCEGMPYVASDVFAQVCISGDIVILGLLADKRAVGVYSPASALLSFFFFVPNALYTLLIPYFSRAHSQTRRDVGWVLLATAIAMATLGAFLGCFLWTSRTPLIKLVYGPEYIEASQAVAYLSWLLVPRSVSFAMAAYLVGAGQQRARVRVQALAAGLNLALNVALIPSLGWRACALAYWATEILLACGYGYKAAGVLWAESQEPLLTHACTKGPHHQFPLL